MSSRAAASRKRLVTGEDSRPSSSKGFFSRSKNIPALSPHSPNSDQLVVSPATPSSSDSISSFNSLNSSQIPDPYHVNLYYTNSDTTVDKHIRSPNFSGSASSASTLYRPPYPSPPHASDDEYIPNQTVRFNGRPAREARASEYEGATYIEATYQPPPPIHASYQPPPPSHALHAENYSRTDSPRKPARTLLSDAEAHYTLEPHGNIGSALPSPLSSPAQSSVRRLSPTPTEPPTYSSVHEVPYSTPTAATQAIYESSSHSSHILSVTHSGRYQYHDSPTHNIPPSPRPQRLTPSPLQTIAITPSQPTRLLPNNLDIHQVWRNGNGPPAQPSPVLLNSGRDPSPPADARSVGPPGSMSSSDSGSASSGKSVKTTLPTNKFVFPGSRSVARPKASKKASDKLNAKNAARKDSDPNLPSPSSPTNAAFSSELGRQVYAPQNPHNKYPESPSSGSENSGGPSLRSSVVSSTSGNSGPDLSPATPTRMVYPGGRSLAQPSKPPRVKPPRPPKSSSSSTGENGSEGRSKKFMGLLKRKNNNKQPEVSTELEMLPLSQLAVSDNDSNNIGAGDIRASINPPGTVQEYEGGPVSPRERERAKVKHINLRIGSYPLDPYDTVLLDNDRHTGELLARLNPTNSPCFYNYGNNPPTSVLDLGCGQGHWVVDAAIAWKGYGTRVTGYDMVDLSQGLLPWAAEQRVTESVRFVRGNFLTHRLPFSDSAFELVRMSCLTLCIPSESWLSILQEVCRVLAVGGRLEIIDDEIFFPYGKVSSLPKQPQTQSSPPRLNVSIPSAVFTTFRIFDGETTNPGLGPHDPDREDLDMAYGANEDEEDVDDTATLNGRDLQSTPSNSRSTSALRNASPGLSAPAWNRAHATAADVEALFEHMLTHKFGIKTDLPDSILDLMKEVFGHAREVKTMHLILASPDAVLEPDKRRYQGPPKSILHAVSHGSVGLSGSPGLVLWPSTFISMKQSEIEIHASKHLRLLLSCRDFLVEHALEATDDAEIDEESVEEALWQYESFLRNRFSPPSLSMSDEDPNVADFDVASIRESIAESVSSSYREEMWEVHSEFIQQYAWQRPPSSASSSNRSATPTISTPTGSMSRTSSVPSPPLFTTGPAAYSTANNLSTEQNPPTAEPLCELQDESTHVRTFRIYEAIKIDHALFGSAI